MAAPTYVTSYATVYNTDTTPKTASVTTSAGDVLVIVAKGAYEDWAFATPTGNSLTYTQLYNIPPTGFGCRVVAWTATDSTGGTGWTMSITASGSGYVLEWGFRVYRFSGSEGFGNSNGVIDTDGGAANIPLTTAYANSAIVFESGDDFATDNTSTTWITASAGTPTVLQ